MNAFTTDGSGYPAPAGAHWSEFPRGRHFPAMEAPAQLAADLQAFFWPLR